MSVAFTFQTNLVNQGYVKPTSYTSSTIYAGTQNGVIPDRAAYRTRILTNHQLDERRVQEQLITLLISKVI